MSSLSGQVGDMVAGLRGLAARLGEMRGYLEAVAQGRLPVNHDIMRNMQVRAALRLRCAALCTLWVCVCAIGACAVSCAVCVCVGGGGRVDGRTHCALLRGE